MLRETVGRRTGPLSLERSYECAVAMPSSSGVSILHFLIPEPIIEIFRNLVLETHNAVFMLPPVVTMVQLGLERHDADDHVSAEYPVQHPTDAACRKNLCRNDDASRAHTLRPGFER